jgi:transposase
MDTNQFFTVLLGLTSPWKVEKVETDLKTNRVHVYVWYDSPEWIDTKSGEVFHVYDRREERQWHHLDTLQYQTVIHCRIPRIKLHDGKIASCPVPWGDSGERHSYLFEDKVIRVLQATHNQTQSGHLLNVSYEKIHRIMKHAVERGLLRRDLKKDLIVHLHLDEKSYKKGHQYISVLTDGQGSRVLDVEKDRTQAACEGLLEKALPKEQLVSIKAVCVDMWEPYMAAVKKNVQRLWWCMTNFMLSNILIKV